MSFSGPHHALSLASLAALVAARAKAVAIGYILSNAKDIPTGDLGSYTNKFKTITPVINYPNGTWTLSKLVHYNNEDVTAPNLTLYGSSVFGVDKDLNKTVFSFGVMLVVSW